MPGKNKAPLLGWHPPAELAAWAREEAERRGGGRGALSDLLTEALAEKRQRVEAGEGRYVASGTWSIPHEEPFTSGIAYGGGGAAADGPPNEVREAPK